MDDGLGDPEYSFEKYVSGLYGDRITEYFRTWALYEGQDMHPDVVDYWEHYGKGLHKYYHKNEDNYQSWDAYVPCSYDLPENRNRKYPCIIIGQRTTSMMQYESSGFIHMAAENEIIILTGNDVNEDDYFENILDQGLKLYPIDPGRVYLHGHSFGAVLSGRHAIKYAHRIAGVCMSGSQYYGADSSDEEIELAVKLRMPMIAVHCTNQSRNLLPYNITPRRHMSPKNRMNATTSDFTLLTGYEELRFWRMVNHCRPVGIEYMRNIQQLSKDPCEQVLGIEFDETHVEQREGVNHYFGDIYDDQHTLMLRYVAVEGGPHAVPPHAGYIAWDFLKNFSRDINTGALLREGKAIGTNDPFWTTAFPAIDFLTPREYIASHGSTDFDFDRFFNAEVTSRMKDTLYTRLYLADDEAALARYWEERGIRRVDACLGDIQWVLYRPLAQQEPLPLVIYLGDTKSVMDAEASGIVQEAAASGMMTAIPANVNDSGLIEAIPDYLHNAGWLAPGHSVFITGFGFGAQCGGRHAVRMDRWTGAVCLLGDQYYGYDNTPEEIRSDVREKLPVMMIHGTCEERGILPLYENSPLPLPKRRAEHVTQSTFSLISSFSEHTFWRQMNGCTAVSLAEMAAASESEDECIRRIGAPVDETGIHTEEGVRILTGNVKDAAGCIVISYNALDGAPHAALPAAMKLACRFFSEIYAREIR